MLNKNNIRELAYVSEIKSIDPIQGSDNCESATIDGWHVMVRKGIYHVGDKCVYFEIDSRLDVSKECFKFLEKCNGKIKTQKYTFGGKGLFFSQGLIMTLEECGLDPNKYNVGDFLTEVLEVKYADEEDNKRKEVKEYNSIFKKIKEYRIIKWLMRREWGRKIIFAIFGIKKKKKTVYPWFVIKSDEQRAQNLPQNIWDDKKQTYEVTEKIDGTSTTIAIERIGKVHSKKYKLWICSRNVVVWDSMSNKVKQGGYYKDLPSNPYINSAKMYKLCEFLTDYMDKYTNAQWAYLQGETFGESIQKRTYNCKGTDFRAFTFVENTYGRFSYTKMKYLLDEYNIPTVPILDRGYVLTNCDELVELSGSTKSEIDNGMREGIVLRSEQNPTFSFKAVDPNFLIKYHNG
jgi:hypothetical protein